MVPYPLRILLKKLKNSLESLEIMVGIISKSNNYLINHILGLTPEEKAELERKAQEELVG